VQFCKNLRRQERSGRYLLPVLVAWVGILLLHSRGSAQPASIFPDPGLTNPKLRFHTGRAANGAPELSRRLPDIPGEASSWYVTQWNKGELLMPQRLSLNDNRYADARLGTRLYTFDTNTHESRVGIFVLPGRAGVYELAASGGVLTDAGGSDLLLSANAGRADATFDKAIGLSLDMKLSIATVDAPPAAAASGLRRC